MVEQLGFDLSEHPEYVEKLEVIAHTDDDDNFSHFVIITQSNVSPTIEITLAAINVEKQLNIKTTGE